MTQPTEASAASRLMVPGDWAAEWLRRLRGLRRPPTPISAEPLVVPLVDLRSLGTRRFGWNSWLAKMMVALLILTAGLLIRYRFIWVVGNSMRPTYHTGDLLVVDKFAYRKAPPLRGDVVVARYQDEWIIKRVMGLPGEQIEVRQGHVEIDGVRPVTHFAVEPGWLDIAPGTLMEDRYAILGDNRSIDASSFIHAVVSTSQISGKVVFGLKW